jgi:hypothetical protein
MRENDIEKAITDYLHFALPKDAVAFHVPQGGFKLSPWELGQLKRAGYVAGIPDRCILWDGKAYFLECKGPHGKLSPAQSAMFIRIKGAGCNVATVRSIEEVEAALTNWGVPINGRLKLT